MTTMSRPQHQTLTTVEELDTLNIGAVVLSQTYKAGTAEFRVAFQLWDDGEWHRAARSSFTHPHNFLPVTVLHKGEE